MNLNITSNFKTMNLDEEKKVNNKTKFDRNRVGLLELNVEIETKLVFVFGDL